MAKHFKRTIEDFICEKCGTTVKGSGYTNHCPNCLWSKHVDVNPGDRLEPCQGLMKPVFVESKAGEYVLLQECIKCGFKRKNKVGKGDNFDVVLEISKSGKLSC